MSTAILNQNMPVAGNIRRIIKATGLKQCAVAKRIGYSQQEFTDMLCGRRIIKVSDVTKLCQALNVSIAELFYEDKEKAV